MTSEGTPRRPGRGLGRVYLRGTTWWIQYSHRGRKVRESSGSAKESDAVKQLKKRIEEISAGRFMGPDSDRLRFEDLEHPERPSLVRFILDDYKANGRRSLPRLERSIKHLRATFGADRAVDVTADRLVRYLNVRIEDGAALATVANELAALKRMFTLAIRAERLARRPAFPIMHLDNARTGFFEPGDFAAMLIELPDYLRPVMHFAYLTGWRKQEILDLTWSRVDFDAGVVRLDVGTTKNSEGRTFPIAALPALETLLQEQRTRTDELERLRGDTIGWVFHHAGRPIKDYYSAWRTACRRAGLVGRIVHDFRRTAVRNLERAGVSRSVAMQLTGHKTEAIYRRYAIVAEQDLRDGVAKLAALHAPKVQAEE